MQEKTNFGAFINQKRKENGFTQRELADKLYVSESAVSKWERGLSYPDITLVSGLCEALGVTEHELLTSSEDTDGRRMIRQMRAIKRRDQVFLWIFYLIYGIIFLSVSIPFLVQGRVWPMLITLSAIAVAFSVICLPVLLKENIGMWTLGSFFASLSLLLLLCCVSVGGNWFFLVFVVLLFCFSVAFLPFVIRSISLPKPFCNHKTVCCLAADTILLLLILLTTSVRSGKIGEFFTLSIPIALAYSLLPWGITLIIRYLKENGWLKAALCLAFTAVWQPAADFLLHLLSIGQARIALQGANLSDWSAPHLNGNISLVMLLGMLSLSAICAVIGWNRKKEK